MATYADQFAARTETPRLCPVDAHANPDEVPPEIDSTPKGDSRAGLKARVLLRDAVSEAFA